MTTQSPSHEIIIGIPGRWKSRKALIEAIATLSGGYIFAGGVLMHMGSDTGFVLDVGPHDDKVSEAFQLIGKRTLTKDDQRKIARHTFMLYLTGPGGSTINAQAMVQAAAGLLRAGGDAIKVETAGLAHRKKHWLQLATNVTPQTLYQAFVTLIGTEDGTIYTTGMHNLGLPDGIISGVDTALSAQLLQGLALYQMLSDQQLAPGHAFGLTPETANFTLALEPSHHPENDPFYHNRYGMWRLVPHTPPESTLP